MSDPIDSIGLDFARNFPFRRKQIIKSFHQKHCLLQTHILARSKNSELWATKRENPFSCFLLHFFWEVSIGMEKNRLIMTTTDNRLTIMVYQNLCKTYLLEMNLDANFGKPWNLIHNSPCRTSCKLFIHEIFFGPLGLHLLKWSIIKQSPPFDQWELLDCNVHPPSISYVRWPYSNAQKLVNPLVVYSIDRLF